MTTHLMQLFDFSSSSQAEALDSAMLFPSPSASKCFRLFDISFSSFCFDVQLQPIAELNCALRSKWQSLSSERSMLGFGGNRTPDLSAGVLCRAGEDCFVGVWHLDVVKLPKGVTWVVLSLRWTLWAVFENKKLSSSDDFVYSKQGMMGSALSVNLSATRLQWRPVESRKLRRRLV